MASDCSDGYADKFNRQAAQAGKPTLTHKGGTLMTDILIILAFWAMIIGPCLVAMHTGVHLDPEDAG
jgi:hypothetical protein